MTDMNQPSPPSLQPPGLHVPPLPATPSLHLPATLRMLPWITDAATGYLDNIIGTKRAAGEEIHALECGAGSSTGYLAQRVTHLVSLDHDESWHQAIRAAVSAIGCANVEWRRHDRPYFTLLDDYPEATFDIILVDGRDRTACVQHARRVLKRGGVILIDNTERIGSASNPGPYYAMLEHLRGWQGIHFEQSWKDRAGWTPPHRWITSVWRKPGSDLDEFFTTSGYPL